jgi:hypothetical protein
MRLFIFALLLTLSGCAANVKNLPNPSLDGIKPIRGGTLALKVQQDPYGQALHQALERSGMFASVSLSDTVAPSGYTIQIKREEWIGRDPIRESNGVLYNMGRMIFSVLIPMERTDQLNDSATLFYNGQKISQPRISYERELRFGMNPLWALTGKPLPSMIDTHAANQFAASLLVELHRHAQGVAP